jgi:putative ABC transport system permease protein
MPAGILLALYRFCSLACPRAFRREHQPEMEQLFSQGTTAERFFALVDMVGAGIAERFRLLAMDARVALRGMTKTPLVSTIVVLTFAIGIGATVAAFAIVDSVMLRPLPFPRADRLVQVRDVTLGDDGDYVTPLHLYRSWRTDARLVESIAVFNRSRGIYTGNGAPQTVAIIPTRGDYFSVLGTPPFIGRVFRSADTRAGASPVAIISYRLWQSRYAGNASALGRPITLDGRTYRIVGVMPTQFIHPDVWEFNYLHADVWLPHVDGGPASFEGGERVIGVSTARLRDGVSLAAAQAEFSTIARREPSLAGQTRPHDFRLLPLSDALFGTQWPKITLVLWNAMGVMLIACANVANLFLARGALGRQALAVRIALGASRGRIVAQVLTEAALFACAGALLGTAVAALSLGAFENAFPTFFTRAVDVHVNWALAGVVLATTVVVSILAGLVPALMLSQTSVRAAVAEQTRSSTGRTARLRAAFVIVEVALAVAVVTQCGLVLRSYAALGAIDPGFRAAGIVLAALPDLPDRTYPNTASRARFITRVLTAARTLPGITSASAGFVTPFSDSEAVEPFTISGMSSIRGAKPAARISLVSDAFFRELSIPVIAGRLFQASDGPSTSAVAIVNAEFVRRYFPNENPLGKHLTFGIFREDVRLRTVVGVVANTKIHSLTEPVSPMMYADINQLATWTSQILLQTQIPASVVARDVTEAVRAVDPTLPPTSALPYSAYVERARNDQYVSSVLLALLAAVALFLAASGVYGAISYAVSVRAHEFGIRLALGAQPVRLIRTVIREAILLASFGIVAGIVLSIFATPLEDSLLYNVPALDPITFVTGSLVLFATALIAGFIPAQRAAGATPLSTLHRD